MFDIMSTVKKSQKRPREEAPFQVYQPPVVNAKSMTRKTCQCPTRGSFRGGQSHSRKRKRNDRLWRRITVSWRISIWTTMGV